MALDFARAYGILFFDFLEAASLALVMTTFSEVFGTVAGVFTLMKFMFFVPLVFISLGVAWPESWSYSCENVRTKSNPINPALTVFPLNSGYEKLSFRNL